VSRLAIPGLIDLLRADTSGEIAELATDPRLDRDYRSRGPLINRLVVRGIRRALAYHGTPLPSVAPRDDPERQRAQDALETFFATTGDAADPASVAALVGYVRGGGSDDDLGPLAQQAIGRLFVDNYRADRESWAAARVLGSAPSNLNPIRALVWALTRRVARAQALLGERVNGDRAAIHATGVAVHNMVEAFKRMRALYADPRQRAALSDEAAVAHALVAPRQVVRQPTEAGTSSAGKFGPGSVVLLRLEKANARELGFSTAFLTGQWSQCPARNWVPALYGQVWRAAVAGGAT
jgi:hypothetical protein